VYVQDNLQELVRAHLAVIAMLESPLISYASRQQLEAFRDELETEIATGKEKKDDGPQIAA
jgi:hypothetical protein